MIDKRVGVTSTDGVVYSSGKGRIAIPPEVDRDIFVQSCLSTGLVSVQPELNGIINRVKCDRSILQQITFPKNSNEFGSSVVYVYEPKSKQPYIVSISDNVEDYNDLKENQFSFHKESENGISSISGDGKGNMLLSVFSEKDKSGRIDINVSNKDNTSKLSSNVKGTFDLYASSGVSIETNRENSLEATDGDNLSFFKNSPSSTTIQSNSSKISIDDSLIVHNEGSEPMVLGDTLLSKISDIIDEVDSLAIECSKIVVPTGLGPSGIPINAAQFISISTNLASIKSMLSEFLSSRSKLD